MSRDTVRYCWCVQNHNKVMIHEQFFVTVFQNFPLARHLVQRNILKKFANLINKSFCQLAGKGHEMLLLPQTSNQPIRSSSGPDTRALSSSPKEVPSEKFSPATLKRSSHLMDLLIQSSLKRKASGLVNFVPADVYYFCLA